MLDVSDGLLADLMHLAVASGVAVDVDSALLAATPGPRLDQVLTGGEDHALVATFAPDAVLPDGWRRDRHRPRRRRRRDRGRQALGRPRRFSHFGHSA